MINRIGIGWACPARRAASHRVPVHLGQGEVQHHQIGPPFDRQAQGFAPVGGGHHGQALVLQRPADRLPHLGIVVDHHLRSRRPLATPGMADSAVHHPTQLVRLATQALEVLGLGDLGDSFRLPDLINLDTQLVDFALQTLFTGADLARHALEHPR